MSHPLRFVPTLFILLAACGGAAEPPQAATPPPAGTPAAPTAPSPSGAPASPAAAPAAALPPLVEGAIGRVQGLLADANDAAITGTFSPTFLAAVAPDKVKTIFTQELTEKRVGLSPP